LRSAVSVCYSYSMTQTGTATSPVLDTTAYRVIQIDGTEKGRYDVAGRRYVRRSLEVAGFEVDDLRRAWREEIRETPDMDSDWITVEQL
jgi:hypothetical protein